MVNLKERQKQKSIKQQAMESKRVVRDMINETIIDE